MAASTVRDLGFLAWTDPDAWMESMQGDRWNAVVKEENERFHDTLTTKTTSEQIEVFKAELTHAATFYNLDAFTINNIIITPGAPGGGVRWRFEDETEKRIAHDVQTNSIYVVYTHDIGKGAETYELVVLDAKTKAVLWKHSPVGPSFSLTYEWIYYLGVSQKLWYNQLFVTTINNFNSTTKLYTENDPHYNLSIVRSCTANSYLVRENAGKTDTFHIYIHHINTAHSNMDYSNIGHKLIPVGPGTARQFPYGGHLFYLYREEGEDTYHKSYNMFQRFGLPLDIVGVPVSLELDQYISRKNGELYVISYMSEYDSDGLEFHISQGSIITGKNRYRDTYLIDDGTQPPYLKINLKNKKQANGFKLKAKKVEGVSSDGITVHGVVIYKSIYTKPKALLAVGYGAYGVPSSPAGCYGKWAPLLERGWGILYTYIRGGGDDTDGWAQAGRLEGRFKTRDDFLALVEATQKILKIKPQNTVIYGRSAGGLLMGMSLAKEPTGRLFKGVYTEVPYVDVLRTTTNPALPLTKMEYNEFGDPAHKPHDMGFLVNMSPADLAVTLHAPDIFVMARTGLNDSEVYAYEPVKWIRRLRNGGDSQNLNPNPNPNPQPKIIGIAEGEGHFYSERTALQAKAEDLAILHSMFGVV